MCPFVEFFVTSNLGRCQ